MGVWLQNKMTKSREESMQSDGAKQVQRE